MDKQPKPMHNMHNTFWREDQVIVTFHSKTKLNSPDGVQNGKSILDLEAQLKDINVFLREPPNEVDFTLSLLDGKGHRQVSPSSRSRSKDGSFNPQPGVYLFDLSSSDIEPTYGTVNTSIVTVLNINRDTGKAIQTGNVTGRQPTPSPVAQIVSKLNNSLKPLNTDPVKQIPISAASPVWLCGATSTQSPVPQGCPLTPPMAVDDSCASWHINLSNLSPRRLKSMKGVGVTVFILDTLPDRKVISRAAKKAGDDNSLLFDVDKNVKFNYSIPLHVSTVRGAHLLATGKDVYGRHVDFKMPDHGLFIAGIVRDIAPKASIECIRVLNEYCVGDMNTLIQALQYIHDRMSSGGDLNEKPVVINMSLVIPTKDETKSKGIDPDTGGPDNDVLTCLRQPIQSLVDLGAIFVASAGNEGDMRENPMGNRPPALYPAAFANPPESIEGIIPVGAVKGDGKVTSYSCFPGPRGIATYGGEIPTVDPPDPPRSNPTVTFSDALRGIYSSKDYPALSSDSPFPEYKAPNDHGWAYWVGTSFATPIISAVASRVLELKSKGVAIPDVPHAVIAAGTGTTSWVGLDPKISGTIDGTATGPMLLAKQTCNVVDEDEEEVDIEVISVVEEGEEVDIEVIDVVVKE